MALTPAELVIKMFGGARSTAALVGRSAPAVYKWLKPKSQKGTGGAIPRALHQKVLQVSKRRKLGLSADDIIFGR